MRPSSNEEILSRLHGGLIVSCQALPNEPLHSSYIMGRLAFSAMVGGAVGIRANTPEDIREIKKVVQLPVIALFKKDYDDSPVYITPTMQEVDLLMEEQPEIVAMDATNRPRPGGVTLEHFFHQARQKYPNQLFMADCATYQEGLQAQALGFDLVSTTLCGYTEETSGTPLPNLALVKQLAANLTIPVISEGGIWEPEDLRRALDAGAFAAVIGAAITRPQEITRRFVQAIG